MDTIFLVFFHKMLYSRCVWVYGNTTYSDGSKQGGSMNCKEFEKNIPEFIAGKLDFLTLQEFGEHMQECPGCKEELVIQFLVTEGMQRLEDGDAFDLQRELEIRLTEAKRKVKIHMSFLKAGAVLEVITVIFLLGFLGWIIS